MSNASDSKSSLSKPSHARRTVPERWSFFDYFWFVLKNVVGWIFMLAAPVLGVTIPGPGGIPVFLIGFALVSFPGKRKLTSHVMRGRAVKVDPQLFTMLATICSIAATAFVIWLLYKEYKDILDKVNISFMPILAICALAAAVTWLVMRLTVWLANWALRSMPRIRRYIRPWLRRRGINLLPPRRRRASGEVLAQSADEILQFSDTYRDNLQSIGGFALAWLRRGVMLAITLLLVYFIFAPLLKRWNHLTLPNQVLLVIAVIAAATVILLALAVILRRRRAVK